MSTAADGPAEASREQGGEPSSTSRLTLTVVLTLLVSLFGSCVGIYSARTATETASSLARLSEQADQGAHVEQLRFEAYATYLQAANAHSFAARRLLVTLHATPELWRAGPPPGAGEGLELVNARLEDLHAAMLTVTVIMRTETQGHYAAHAAWVSALAGAHAGLELQLAAGDMDEARASAAVLAERMPGTTDALHCLAQAMSDELGFRDRFSRTRSSAITVTLGALGFDQRCPAPFPDDG